MIKSRVCPRCLADLSDTYTEEGHIIIYNGVLVCDNCGFVIEGAIDDE